ncbi:hypothetical protein DFA_05300 [Cavenderia fasciculata]|uniref:Uncharacterized protein n=1 Tax=Cavenderia fasciculata TaxID=261658 RepID=F4PNW5_CACFS|nr:uncharacterized protein DFA_05300 [Cavenderia fasciculata]EGG23168.1 hypothetical protein DFA_05300 [Cavenderia fasciculata]|eukprot:XP_004361019.1 hypothetical protein DFA_05300 [Cavenderia fasciculata]
MRRVLKSSNSTPSIVWMDRTNYQFAFTGGVGGDETKVVGTCLPTFRWYLRLNNNNSN